MLIQFRNDNIIHFINTDGKALDENTEELIKKKNIKLENNYKENDIKIIDIQTKKLLIPCLNTFASYETIKNNLLNLLNELKNKLIKENILVASISKDIKIRNLPWIEIEQILKETFNNTNIKIIVWFNKIEYVKPSDRDKIFEIYHSSKIGRLSGVKFKL